MKFYHLSSTGLVVIPQFLSNEEVALLYDEYHTQEETDNKNYSYKNISQSTAAIIHKKIEQALQLIKKQTLLDIDLIVPGGIYINNQLVNFPWHQDHESFYSLQQHSNYLNFYIPILKEYPDKSGLHVIPFDKIKEYIPQYLSKIKNNGATRYDTTNSEMTSVYNDETGEEYTIPFNISNLCLAPRLLAGDLLVMRGDIIHRTQDTETNRISVSFRATQGNALISKERLLSGCAIKQDFIKKNSNQYEGFLKTFEKLGKDTITARELFGNI